MKNVFITGISRGLGQELLTQFSSKKYFVFGLLRNEEVYKQLLKTKPSNVEYILADITNDSCIKTIQEKVEDKPIDLLINNAGIGGRATKLHDIDTQELQSLFDTHCLGAFRVSKSLENNLLRSTDATVININSRLGSIEHQSIGTYKELSVSYSYRIAKAAQNMLTNCMKHELGDRIKFISLHPGRLQTELSQKDADMTSSEGAEKIIKLWEEKLLENTDGIIDIQAEEVLKW